MPQRMGVIGLRPVGRAIATRLSTHPKLRPPLVVLNHTTKEAEDFAFQHENSKATSALTLVVRNADIIWLCLDDEEELNAVFQVSLGSDVQGKVFIVVADEEKPSAEEKRSREVLVKHVQAKGAQLVSLQGNASLQAGCTLSGAPAAVDRVSTFVRDTFVNITIAPL
ncbi:hypothetical protein CKM354_000874200 [Cercospora kikuchii]|uniref:6-phosphogluconate dehydrogenase NADP-binding domain-containing protein n=1 Tax=Cercospora kikuchii TaxID=84275 RepID=A0A9P3CLU6_9PEZI|nr:uncharacterized protein CKM354_000874200 [Cercospora kikuchii]GIZ45582.1 hypothetical protein CKM354_000874200 [Cercospora kikuchii]